MDKIVNKDLETTMTAQEKLKKEREGRGAEQLTPQSREVLLEKAEGVWRMIADTESRQQREKEDRIKSQDGDDEAVARLSAAFEKELPSIAAKAHEEGENLARLMELRDERDGGELRKQLEAIEADLGSGSSHEMVAPHSSEEAVLQTSKKLMPDVRKETAASSEHPDVEKPSGLKESADVIDDDRRYQKLIEDASLEYLKTKDRDWFYKNFSGELAPSGYLLDKKGQETNFLPSQNISAGWSEVAEKAKLEFEIKYPQEAEKYKQTETEQPQYEAEKTSSSRLTEDFVQAGIEFKTIKIENGGEFFEAIILQKQEIPVEKMVRIYRGINHLDGSVLEQIPYAMRTEHGTGKPMVLEQVRQEVDALAKNPTYENLLAYVDKVRQNLSPDEARRMDDDLIRIENGILEGHSTRNELIFKQIEHGGGWGDSGITPYISASFDPYEAAGYGNEGLMVIDVPLSEIEDFGTDSSEVNVKGALDKKYITAILPRKRGEAKDDQEKINQQIYQALQKVYESTEVPLFGDEEMHFEREKKIAEEIESDKEQQKKDVEKVRQVRVEKLAKVFPEMKISFQDAQEKSAELEIDPYTKVKRDIFDQYKTRLEKIGRNGKSIDDYEFLESGSGGTKKFDREKASDLMLIKLRELTLRLEEQGEERKRRVST